MSSLYNDQIAFVHVPKTGGSWVAEALRYVLPDLKVPGGAGDFMGEHRTAAQMPAGRFSFGFVRHPATWYRSYFMFVKAKGVRAAEGDLLWEAARTAEDFNEFVQRATSDYPGVVTSIYRQYLEGVDFVGRYENLTNDLVRALRLADVVFDSADLLSVAPVNESRGDKPEITPLQLMAINESEEATYRQYGYEVWGTPVIQLT